ncbi:hypothetical protein [Asanoa siamensis]|uniref:Uncharacterized protein n=1 Tax=Asanoa siamensis TaxID=926357 RepID=A0ABQ4CWU3_9ACTN|nr:hypothetical protein [Asanoa siamensis]GIF75307.1 hypothetical protein Asi02nite_48250 [Asanoa siamensis]
MALHLTATRIVSDSPGCDLRAERHADGWHVPGHPGSLDLNRAMLAMLIAEVHALNPPPQDPRWAHVAEWWSQIARPYYDGGA